MDVLVAAVHQRHDQRVQHASLPGLDLDEPEPTEVDLGHLARRHLVEAHGLAQATDEPAVLDREAPQRRVADLDPLALEEAMDLGQPQRLATGRRGLEPRGDRRAMRSQVLLCRAELLGLRARPNGAVHLER
ncbi:MAG: hypothetical protein HC841_07270, partial [Verrucomicrobiae bacterium]|nr:hypothetical protein [Verrucomicrobiae bacterium]